MRSLTCGQRSKGPTVLEFDLIALMRARNDEAQRMYDEVIDHRWKRTMLCGANTAPRPPVRKGEHLKQPRGTPSLGTVLVIEDEDDIRHVLLEVLWEEGYETVGACNGDAALEIMHGYHVDIVLLDLMMPVMDGIEFRQRQLAEPGLVHVPVIAVSAARKLEE